VRRRGGAAAALLIATTGACADDGMREDVRSGSSTTITVFAAASLKESFTAIGERFELANPRVTVRFSFAGSSDLLAQMQQGAPADVFASADTETMDDAVDLGLVDGSPVDVASNTLQIATGPGNPAGIDSFADLADPDLKVVVCAPQVPCGAVAKGAEEAAGVDLRPVSEEQSVTDVLGKIVSGEADAGLVYVTDVMAAGDRVLGVPFPEASRVVNTCPVAALADSEQLDTARSFAHFVASTEGRAILEAAGFGEP
jgi:molybdate transport system substrate-binding protein